MSLIFEERGEAGVINTHVQHFLDSLETDPDSLEGLSPDEIRSAPAPVSAYEIPALPVLVEDVSFKAREGQEIFLRVYRKNKANTQAPMVFFHGGCWVFCSIDSHDPICRKLAYDNDMTVISVGYRLAPEHPFPRGVQDAYDAVQWIDQNRKELNLDASAITLCGDSAGANICIAISHMVAENPQVTLAAQILFYPITDVSSMNTQSYQKFAKNHFLTADLMQYASNHYLPQASDRSHHLVSPLHSKQLASQPKTLILSAEFDVLRDEGEAFAQKLAKAGVNTRCLRYNGLIHAFAAIAGKIPLALSSFEDINEFIKE